MHAPFVSTETKSARRPLLQAMSDEELVDHARQGDGAAFATLLQRHDRLMRGVSWRYLGSAAAMDDALQDAYVKAYRNMESFDGRSSFSTWLHTIVVRTCLDAVRASGRRRELPLETVTPPPANDPGPGDRLGDAEQLAAALRSLPEEQAGVVILVDGEGLSYDEAGVVLGVAPGTVASRLSRGRSRLRALLDRHERGGRGVQGANDDDR